MIEIIACGNDHVRRVCPWLYPKSADRIEELFHMLSLYPLDPEGSSEETFITLEPEYVVGKDRQAFKGCARIFGAFQYIVYSFDVITDELQLIEKMKDAIELNKEMAGYKEELRMRERRLALGRLTVVQLQAAYVKLSKIKHAWFKQQTREIENFKS